jgi:sugar phosphate isomerase/epimerase
LIALTDAFAPKNVGVCWDFGHGQINYQEKQTQAIAMLKDRICAVHIHDNNGKDDQHHPPFIGTVVWEEVMPALRQANYKGCLNYEIGVNKTVPDLLRDEMAKYCFKAGDYLMKMFEETTE